LRLAGQGAVVTACDFSEGMLAQARSKPGAEKVRWVMHDLSKRLPFEDGEFDRVLCALVLDHVREVPAFFRELARVCAPVRGRVVISCMHPAMMLRGVQARFIDPATGGRVMPESVPNQISDYVMGAAGAGLRIVHMSEHVADEALVKIAPRAEKHLGWPMLLMMVLERA
jgi:ubiquinone/menaquinone biosynthesis C-methylase UbiE